MPTTNAPSEEPDFGRYRIVAKVRSGPVTDLYRGEQVALGRPVLIKALGRGILPGSPFSAALEREARLLTLLDHPGVIRAYDFVRDATAMWLVLEHVDGHSLDELVSKKGKLSPAASIAIALAAAEALGHVHARGMVHRDLQPINVLVSRAGSVKLTNFAAAADERLPTAPELLEGGSGFGTPAYMSPEQLLGEPEDPRSDLFSLGIVLYEMLTGQKPFAAQDDRAASHRIRHDPAPAPSRLSAGISGPLDRVVRRCLAKLPSDRPATAGELARELSPLLEETGFRTPAEAITAELVQLGLASAAKGDGLRREPLRPTRSRARATSVSAVARGHLLSLLLIVAGASAIQLSSKGRREGASGGAARLELVPPRSGFLRVVADPWANVIVDGEPVDTTPFAHPIPLPAGVHYVRLEHPNAPAERRTVALEAGETVLLDVKMDIPRASAPRPESASLPSLSDPKTP